MVFGLISVTAGTPAITVNGVFPTSAPVVMVTLRDPVTATLSIVIGTDALVGPLTVSVPGAMLAPKLTVVVGPKWVPVPVITIFSLYPWCAEAGLSTAVTKLPVPVPESATSNGLGLPALATVSAPMIVPEMVGANWISIVQFLPAASVPPVSEQVVPVDWIWKSPEGTTLSRAIGLV